MNTPTPTPRTDAATYPADCLGKTLVTNRDCSRALERELVTLTGAYTCTHHTDQKRAACPVCLVTALTAERDQLRSDCENETKWAAHYLADAIASKARAERAEAALATERSRLDYLSTRGFEHRHRETGDHLAFEWTISSTNELKDVSLREVIDAAMKEGAK
jgi:hypothetical protein